MPEIDSVNYSGNAEVEEDYENDSSWLLDSDRDNYFTLPFTTQGGELIMSNDDRKLETCFEEFFGKTMWEEIAHNTNLYVHKKKAKLEQDA